MKPHPSIPEPARRRDRYFSLRGHYSQTALILLLLGETAALCAIHFDGAFWWPCVLGIAVLLTVLACIGAKKNRSISFRSIILTKLLANAISPQPLGAAYLLLFALHLGWLTDVVSTLFLPDALADALRSCGVCLGGLMVLILFFPIGMMKKDEDATDVIFSGMSLPSVPSNKNFNALNVAALALILGKKDLSRCRLVVLKSDYKGITDECLKHHIQEVLAFVFCQDIAPDLPPEMKETRATECEERARDMLAPLETEEQLRLLIREAARKTLDNPRGLDEMKIEFTKACDYNRFHECYEALAGKVSEYDTAKHRLTFYATPGTALVTSVITLMAIDGERELYYCSQDPSIPKEEKLRHIDKKEIPLKNLLSQALDTLEP